MMKRILLVLLICLPMLAMAQKKKMAIYVAPGDEKIKSAEGFISSELTSAFVRSGNYQVVERANDFLKKISEEQGYQHSGSVDDEQISALGKQFGVEYLCVAKISSFGNLYQISARMLDIETATVQASAEEYFSSSKPEDLLTATRKMVQNLINPNTENQPSSDEDVYSFENHNLTTEKPKGQIVHNSYSERHYGGYKEFSYGSRQMDRREYANFLRNTCFRAYRNYVVGNNMVKAGWVLFGVGCAFVVTGGGMMADWDEGVWVAGFSICMLGVAVGGTSLIVLPIGYTYRNKRSVDVFNNQCTRKRTTACTFNLQSSSNGLGVALRF